MLRHISLVLAGLLLSGVASPASDRRQRVEFNTLVRSVDSDAVGARDEVILDRERLEAAWRELFGESESAPAVPDVDFGRRMVVVVAMGVQPTSGYSIEVTRLTLVRGASAGIPVLRVSIREVRPRGCFELPSATAPVHIIDAPQVGDVTFVRTRIFDRCQ